MPGTLLATGDTEVNKTRSYLLGLESSEKSFNKQVDILTNT